MRQHYTKRISNPGLAEKLFQLLPRHPSAVKNLITFPLRGGLEQAKVTEGFHISTQDTDSHGNAFQELSLMSGAAPPGRKSFSRGSLDRKSRRGGLDICLQIKSPQPRATFVGMTQEQIEAFKQEWQMFRWNARP